MLSSGVLIGVIIGVLIVASGAFLGVRSHLRKECEDDII